MKNWIPLLAFAAFASWPWFRKYYKEMETEAFKHKNAPANIREEMEMLSAQLRTIRSRWVKVAAGTYLRQYCPKLDGHGKDLQTSQGKVGSMCWYLEKCLTEAGMTKQWRLSQVVNVDRSLTPPSYGCTIIIGEVARFKETERDRLCVMSSIYAEWLLGFYEELLRL
jgi:hypothetical protein